MAKRKIAAQLYTLREYTKNPEELEKTLKRVKSIGYDSVQVQMSCCKGVSPEAFKKMADNEGLKICASHIPYRRLISGIDEVIEEHKLFGCQYVGIEEMPREYWDDRESYCRFAREASDIGGILKENGLHLIYHNHNFELQHFSGTTGLDILIRESVPENLEFEIDTYWIQAGGGDPSAWIRKLKTRMPIVHLKDMALDKDRNQVFAEVGEGNLNWSEILLACEEAGVSWYIVEQDKCLRDPFESLKISLDNLNKICV